MVIISPAIPSETVKLEPMEVSKPMGRISVVTMENIPIITEITAGHEVVAGRLAASVVPAAVAASVGMGFRSLSGVDELIDHQLIKSPDEPLAGSRRQRWIGG
ncbi:hypothetical protein ABZ547_19060 [Streptomyces sparsogenes]|uniref:hypothetical protein n=1 Tax=Streptomyces sparsogenes TaxID=67365 RepID=UPI00340C1ACE